MRKGTRTRQPLCRCGCGQKVPPTFDASGHHKGYHRCCPGHKRPWTEKQRAAFQKNRKKREKKIGSRRKQLSGKGRPVYWLVKVQETGRWMLEHRRIMELKLKRKLKKHEHVHHINGNGLDNRPANLLLMTHQEHSEGIARQNQKNKIGLFDPVIKKCPICGWRHPVHPA